VPEVVQKKPCASRAPIVFLPYLTPRIVQPQKNPLHLKYPPPSIVYPYHQREHLMPTQPKNDQQITSWIATYRASLTRFIRSEVNNMAQFEDVQQEVWLKLLEHPALQEIERIQNWLFTVACNFITDQRRKHRPYRS